MAEEVALRLGVKRCKLSLRGQRVPSKLCASFPIECLSENNLIISSPAQFSSPVQNGVSSPLAMTGIETDLSENGGHGTVGTLPNIGNTCFMNAILHVLRITPNFIPWLHRTVKVTRNSFSELIILHKIYQTLRESEGNASSEVDKKEELETQLRTFLNIFASRNPQFTTGQQFDAHEFLCWLVTLFRWSSNGTKAPNSFMASTVEGRAKMVVFCNECETSTAQEDTFWDLKIPLSTIYESTEYDVRASFNANTVLSGEDKYLCNTCLQWNEARHSLRILSLPAILIVHVPSKWQNSGENNPLKILEELPCIRDSCSDNCCDTTHRFRLYAVLMHIGSSRFGHYTTLMRRPLIEENSKDTRHHTRSQQLYWEHCCQMPNLKWMGKEWILCDDDKVVSYSSVAQFFATLSSCSSAQPSVLWYQRQC